MERRVLIEAPLARRPLAEVPERAEVAVPVQGELMFAEGSWALEREVWDAMPNWVTQAGLPPGTVMEGALRFSDWSRELPPSRGWWLVREQPGGEINVLWFEPGPKKGDGSWHLEGDGSEGFPKGEPGLGLGMHSELTNIDWCGLAAPWPEYPYALDVAMADILWKKDITKGHEIIKRRALTEVV